MKEILREFINQQLQKYEEPQRQGTPRGYTIGFAKKKYHAALLMLTGEKLKDIAEEAGVPYGSLRNWNMEEDFKKMVSDEMDSFFHFLHEKVKQGKLDLTVELHDLDSKETLIENMKHTVRHKIYKRLSESNVSQRRPVGYEKEYFINYAMKLLSKPFVSEESRRLSLMLLSFVKDMY